MNIKTNVSKISVLVLLAICVLLIYLFVDMKNDRVESIEDDKVENNKYEEVDRDMDETVENAENNTDDIVEKYPRKDTITFPSLDELVITADLYLIDKTSPIILLFHRAAWSRGEYSEIAPKLNELGYNAIAIDARAGYGINDVKNETAKRSYEEGMGTTYIDAAKDIEAAIQYAKDELNYDSIITWGSSYSASLVVSLSQKYSDTVIAVMAFSPGEYFELENKTTKEYAKGLTLPAFITGSKLEETIYGPIFKAIASEEKVCFIPESNGFHGSKVLWDESSGNQEYWDAVTTFLNSLR